MVIREEGSRCTQLEAKMVIEAVTSIQAGTYSIFLYGDQDMNLEVLPLQIPWHGSGVENLFKPGRSEVAFVSLKSDREKLTQRKRERSARLPGIRRMGSQAIHNARVRCQRRTQDLQRRRRSF